MSKAEWGVKRTCITCRARFYDLMREPIVCPKCGAELDITVLLKPKRAKPTAKAAAPKAAIKDIDLIDDEVEVDDDSLDDDDDDDAVVAVTDDDEEDGAVVAKKGSKASDDDDDDDLDDLDGDVLLADDDDDDDANDADLDVVSPKKPIDI
ncbi:MAG TPA: TIGR02300 family protein [Thermohalobaculum sp.]|nr:TIGR02300 family protein [Thermohalobaculum sp.]